MFNNLFRTPKPEPVRVEVVSGRKLVTFGGMDALAYGELTEAATERLDRHGKPYTTARLLIAADGANSDPVAVNLVTRVPSVGLTLLEMQPGDRIAVNGPVSFKREGDHTSVGMNVRRLVSNYRTVEFTQRKHRND